MRVDVKPHRCRGCPDPIEPGKQEYLSKRIDGVLYHFHMFCAPKEEEKPQTPEILHPRAA